jgi:hypothetical protein
MTHHSKDHISSLQLRGSRGVLSPSNNRLRGWKVLMMIFRFNVLEKLDKLSDI